MGKHKNIELNEIEFESQEMNDEVLTKYVVIRDGYRVSDSEYDDPDDPGCQEEFQTWNSIAKKHSYGEKVEIVQYDSKKHRVW